MQEMISFFEIVSGLFVLGVNCIDLVNRCERLAYYYYSFDPIDWPTDQELDQCFFNIIVEVQYKEDRIECSKPKM